MNWASDTAFLMPTSLSNAYPSSIVFQSLIFMGTLDGNNQVSLMAHMGQSTRAWLHSSCLDSATFVSRRDGKFVLQFLSFQSNQSNLSSPIFHGLMSWATRDSFVPCSKVVFNSNSSKAECSDYHSFMYLAPRRIGSHGLSFPLCERQTWEVNYTDSASLSPVSLSNSCHDFKSLDPRKDSLSDCLLI